MGPIFLSKYYIKVKPFDNLAEAHTMQFIAQHTSIPVPNVHCAFVHNGSTYIVMSKIEGTTLWQGWTTRSDESKKRILDQVKVMLTELRALAAPEGTGVANVNGGPICDCRLATLHSGPFTSVREFHKALANGADLEMDRQKLPDDMAELIAFYKDASDKIVFTHGDMNSLNIILQGEKVVGIIDWETSGWLPEYWEYTCARYVNIRNQFWEPEVDKFLTPMPREQSMELVRRKYFGPY